VDVDNEGVTALHWAAGFGHDDLVELLLQLNAKPNPMDIAGNKFTPYNYAASAGYQSCIDILVRYGGRPIEQLEYEAATRIKHAYLRFSERKRRREKRIQMRQLQNIPLPVQYSNTKSTKSRISTTTPNQKHPKFNTLEFNISWGAASLIQHAWKQYKLKMRAVSFDDGSKLPQRISTIPKQDKIPKLSPDNNPKSHSNESVRLPTSNSTGSSIRLVGNIRTTKQKPQAKKSSLSIHKDMDTVEKGFFQAQFPKINPEKLGMFDVM
jgi:hypothetical protein